MANTHVLIASNTVTGSSTSQIVFSSIPQTYSDLKVIVKSKVDGANGNLALRFNSSTGAYNQIVMDTGGSGSGPAYSSSLTSIAYWYTATTNSAYDGPRFAYNEIAINHYTGSNYKGCRIYSFLPGTVSGFDGKSNTQAQWVNTDAITSLNIFNYSSHNFIVGSTFQLYGIKRN